MVSVKQLIKQQLGGEKGGRERKGGRRRGEGGEERDEVRGEVVCNHIHYMHTEEMHDRSGKR